VARFGVTCFAILLAAAGCGDDGPSNLDSTAPVASVEIFPHGGTVAIGANLQLNAIPRDNGGRALSNRPIAWSTSDPQVANVFPSGMVAGLASGTAQITATIGGKAATVSIQVTVGGAAGLVPAVITYLGGSGDSDMTRDVAVDGQGNIYLAGGTNSPDFPVTAGAFDVSFNNPGSDDQDVFVQKRSPSGQILWSTFIGGHGYDRAYAIEVDAQGFVYVAGRAGAGFPVTAGALQTAFAGGITPNDAYGTQDGFICKLQPDGSAVVFCTYFGNDDYVPIRDIALDGGRNIYLVTSSDRGTFPSAWFANSYQKTRRGGRDMLVAKLDASGSQIHWATYIGGSGDELNTNSVRLDGAGNVYALTTTRSSDAPTPNGFDHSLGGTTDLYVVKFSPDGSQLMYGTYVGGSGGDFSETHELWVTAQGEAIAAAMTSSSDFPTTAGAFQTSLQGIGSAGSGANTNYPGDGMIARISVNGSQLLAGTYLGGRFGDGIEGVEVNAIGEVYVSGTTYSTNFPVTSGATAAGNTDMFVAKLSADLKTLIYSTTIGGSGQDNTRSSTLDALGGVYLAGVTSSANLPVMNATQSSRRAGDDGALVKLVPN